MRAIQSNQFNIIILSSAFQRREAALLKTFLPEKYEYVIFSPMTDVQVSISAKFTFQFFTNDSHRILYMLSQNRLYEYFLENNPLKDKLGGKSLISDYTILRKIWTHPKVLENAYLNALREEDRKKDKQRRQTNEEEEDERPDDFLDSQEGKMSVKNDWWRPYVTKEDLETILPSNKLKILFEILKKCKENGEKCLIFSAFVAVLDVVEFFMRAITKQTQEGVTYSGLENFRSIWKYGEDYYRLDGKTPRSTRHQMITNFNDPKNMRARVFLISAKAGGQGINLTGANRVILLDTSWNPSNDRECTKPIEIKSKFTNWPIFLVVLRTKYFPRFSLGTEKDLLHLSFAGHGHHGGESLFALRHQTSNELSCRRRATNRSTLQHGRTD